MHDILMTLADQADDLARKQEVGIVQRPHRETAKRTIFIRMVACSHWCSFLGSSLLACLAQAALDDPGIDEGTIKECLKSTIKRSSYRPENF
jgi:hypothetical protein